MDTGAGLGGRTRCPDGLLDFEATRGYSIVLPLQIGPFGAFRGPGRCLIHIKMQHTVAPAPAAPRHGGCWGLHLLCFHMYETPPGVPGKPGRPELKRKHF
jgi:hypothetical protein